MKAFRIHHLLIALAATAAYFTAEELGLVHAWIGYAIAALLVLRIALGLAGTAGFRFARLIPRAGAATARTSGIRSPLIAHALTLALAVCVTGAAATGIAMDRGGTLTGNSIRAHDESREHDREEREHDDKVAVNIVLSPFVGTAHADEGGEGGKEKGGKEEEGLLGEIHETLGSLLLPLAISHMLYMLAFRFELARFMLFVPRRR